MAMRGLSRTLAPRGIAVGIYHPGGVDTRMLREAVGQTQAEAEAGIESGAPFPSASKPLSTEESVGQLMARIAELDMARSGDFISYDGQPLPW
jgi:NAD(P)-dependent dehydrogenase (short-subunit alcohol dehydrogenase family)